MKVKVITQDEPAVVIVDNGTAQQQEANTTTSYSGHYFRVYDSEGFLLQPQGGNTGPPPTGHN